MKLVSGLLKQSGQDSLCLWMKMTGKGVVGNAECQGPISLHQS